MIIIEKRVSTKVRTKKQKKDTGGKIMDKVKTRKKVPKRRQCMQTKGSKTFIKRRENTDVNEKQSRTRKQKMEVKERTI